MISTIGALIDNLIVGERLVSGHSTSVSGFVRMQLTRNPFYERHIAVTSFTGLDPKLEASVEIQRDEEE